MCNAPRIGIQRLSGRTSYTDLYVHGTLPEAELETLKEEVQTLLKKYETMADDLVAKKQKEIETV